MDYRGNHKRRRGASFLEMLDGVTFATNRLQEIGSGKVQCVEQSFPPEGVGEDLSTEKAKEIAMGQLLIKKDNRLAQDRSILTQNAAFSTARTLTTHAEQKQSKRSGGKEEALKSSKKGGTG